jgi:CheY-like chemotaxis protein
VAAPRLRPATAALSEPIDPSGQLRDFSKLIAEALPANIAIQSDVPLDLWVVEIDAAELKFALLNLAFNARDSMPRGGILRVSARNEAVEDDHLGLSGRYVAIEIADSGSGIAPEILPRVFEPFVTTKEVGAGVGLGLSQVHGFAHQSGGAVNIASELGKGTTVRMYLPATELPIGAAASPATQGLHCAVGTVLVVEDQPHLANLAGELFEHWQFDIKVVHRASAALRLLRAGQKIDLVFSDIMMPEGMSGLELAQVMKREFPRLPVLLTSGYSDVAADAVTKGFQVIRKPYRMEELGVRLRSLLGTHST